MLHFLLPSHAGQHHMHVLFCWVTEVADYAAPALPPVLSCCSGASSSAVDIPGERSMEDDAVLLADDEEMGALTASTLQGSPPADGVWQGDAAAAASPPIEDMVMVEQMDVINAAPAEDTAAEEAPADAAAAGDGEASAAATTSQEEVAAAPAAAGSDAAAAAGSEGSVDADAGADNGMSANPFAPSAAVEEPQQQGSDASVLPAEQEGSADAAPAAATSNSGSTTCAVPPPAAEGSGSSEACGGIKAHWQGKSHPVQVPDEF
jgi:ubiquinol-cytochrome c reductase cytochrome c1 subunit